MGKKRRTGFLAVLAAIGGAIFFWRKQHQEAPGAEGGTGAPESPGAG